MGYNRHGAYGTHGLRYTVYGVKLPRPVIFTFIGLFLYISLSSYIRLFIYLGFLQTFIHCFVLGLSYLSLFSYTGLFPYIDVYAQYFQLVYQNLEKEKIITLERLF